MLLKYARNDFILVGSEIPLSELSWTEFRAWWICTARMLFSQTQFRFSAWSIFLFFSQPHGGPTRCRGMLGEVWGKVGWPNHEDSVAFGRIGN